MKKWESVFFRSGELRLHAARHPGSGDRPMVVVPGITTPAGAFAVAASRLADIGSDVYVLDMRGRGLSQRAGYGSHRAGDYAADVLALIDQLGLDQPLLVGHSLGARVVACARAQFPGASAGVVAIDPPMSGPGRRPYPMALDRFLSGLHGRARRARHRAGQGGLPDLDRGGTAAARRVARLVRRDRRGGQLRLVPPGGVRAGLA